MSESFFLFAEPSFVEGMARVLDLGGTLSIYNESFSEAEADAIAIHNDWAMVGKDISYAIDQNKEDAFVKETTDKK